MATKREMSDNTVFFSVWGHKKFIHKILAKSESVRFQPLFKFFGALRELLLNVRLAGDHLYGKWLSLVVTWLSLVVSLLMSLCAVLFPTRCLG